MNHIKYNVILTDGTVGEIDSDSINGQHPDAFIGERITVRLYDENGMIFEKDGVMQETL